MKIIRKDKYSTCNFGELKQGDVFVEMCEGDEFLQMKTTEVGEGYGDCHNAVCLTDGEMYWLSAETKVRRVHAELIITNIEEA